MSAPPLPGPAQAVAEIMACQAEIDKRHAEIAEYEQRQRFAAQALYQLAPASGSTSMIVARGQQPPALLTLREQTASVTDWANNLSNVRITDSDVIDLTRPNSSP